MRRGGEGTDDNERAVLCHAKPRKPSLALCWAFAWTRNWSTGVHTNVRGGTRCFSLMITLLLSGAIDGKYVVAFTIKLVSGGHKVK